jgi:general secretion pathway protein G
MEILIVLIIIMILAGYVGINILNKPGEARVAAANMQIKTLKQAVKLYHAEQRRFPTLEQGLEALCVKPTLPPVPEHYPADGYIDSRSVPEDPWGNAYIYLIPGRQNESFEIISYGADGEEGGEGDDADISSSD